MATIYEIDAEILSCIDMETGEILDIEKLEGLQMERDKKIENAAKLYINLVSDAEQYGARKKHFQALEITAKKRAEGLKSYLAAALAGDKFKTADISIGYRTSEAISIANETAFLRWAKENREDFLTIADPKINLDIVKRAIKAGEEVQGAVIEKRRNIQIR